MTRNTYREHFVAAVKATGLPDGFVPHSLRHYFASLALSRGIPKQAYNRSVLTRC